MDQPGEHLRVVVGVAIAHDHAGQLPQTEVFERSQRPVTQVVPGVQLVAGHEQVALNTATVF
jgi:hypothetical protein